MTVTVNFTGLEPIADALNNLAKSLGASGFATTVKEKPVAAVAPVQQKEDAVQENTVEPKETSKGEEPAYTLEDVRAKLAALNKAGKRAEVKELLTSFGAEKLSEISSDQYSGLMKAAEEI